MASFGSGLDILNQSPPPPPMTQEQIDAAAALAALMQEQDTTQTNDQEQSQQEASQQEAQRSNKIDITYYKHAWPLRVVNTEGIVDDLIRSENIIEHFTTEGQPRFDTSNNLASATDENTGVVDGTLSMNQNNDFPLFKDDIALDGKPSDPFVMRDDANDYNYLYYIYACHYCS